MRIWRVAVTILLIALVLAASMGMVWHHHHQRLACTCTLCHLAIAPPAPSVATIDVAPDAAEYAVWEESFIPRSPADEKPPRAPPA